MLCLTIEHDGHRRVVPLREGEIVLGRASDCDVSLPISTLSSRHASITASSAGVRVRDLGSRNGTFVDGRRVQDELVHPPVSLRFGREVEAVLGEQDSEDVHLDPGVQVAPSPNPGADAAAAGASAGGVTETASAFASTLLRALADGADAAGLLDAVVQSGAAAGAALLELASEPKDDVLHHAIGRAPELEGDLREALDRALESGRHHGRLLQGDGTSLTWAREPSVPRTRVVLCQPTRSARLSGRVLESALRTLKRLGAAPAESASRGESRSRPRFELSGEGVLPGAAPVVRSLHDRMRGALTSELPILLTGETGVGKELYARALHDQSERGGGPFVAVNASALPDNLLESLLFGAQAGAATGVKEQRGLMREADGGTLFLDEIGEMSLDLQAKLLRALELREVLPLGATQPVRVDLRFVTATNRELERDVADGRFRRDLFYRLSGHVYRIPSLRERREDVPAFVNHFFRRECERLGRPVGGISVKAMRALAAHDWPGNVRELEALMRRLANEIEPGEPLRASDLPEALLVRRASGDSAVTLDARIDAFQRPVVKAVLEDCGGNRTAAAQRLGVSRPRLRSLIERLELEDG